MFTFKQKGDFSKTMKFLEKSKSRDIERILDKYGKEGVNALSAMTPKRSGQTANSWSYEVKRDNGQSIITFNNSNIQNGVPVAIILQYGHGTRNGGFVQGIDYINPALKAIFNKITEEAWKEVIG